MEHKDQSTPEAGTENDAIGQQSAASRVTTPTEDRTAPPESQQANPAPKSPKRNNLLRNDYPVSVRELILAYLADKPDGVPFGELVEHVQGEQPLRTTASVNGAVYTLVDKGQIVSRVEPGHKGRGRNARFAIPPAR